MTGTQPVLFRPAYVFLYLLCLCTVGQAVEVRDIDYLPDREYTDSKDRLDVYMPEAADGVPVLVFFHGGGLRIGKKEDARVVASRLVKHGVAVVTPNYRLSPGVRHPAHVSDAAAATAWVISNIEQYGGDPRRIFLAGHSAGAYLAALLSLDKHHLAVHDLEPGKIRGTIPVSPFLYVEETAAVRPKVVWGQDPDDWLAASVTPHLAAGKRPMLLIYADGDDDWRKEQNQRFTASMRAMGNDTNVVEVPRRDHMSLIHEMNAADDQIGELVIRFIEEHSATAGK